MTTALGPEEFCKVVQNPPKPKLLKTEQGNTSNSQPNIDDGKLSGNYNTEESEAIDVILLSFKN